MLKVLRGSLDALGSVRSYTHRMEMNFPHAVQAGLSTCKEYSRSQDQAFTSTYLTSKPFHFAFFWIPAKWIHSKREICGSIKCRVWSNTLLFFLSTRPEVAELSPLLEGLFEQPFCSTVIFPLALPRLQFSTASPSLVSAAWSALWEIVCMCSSTLSSPRNPQRTEKPASLREGMISDHLHRSPTATDMKKANENFLPCSRVGTIWYCFRRKSG